MARKDTLRFQVVEDQSLADDFTTVPTLTKYLDNCSYQINITTTNSVGSFVVEGSNDYNQYEPSPVVTDAGLWCALELGGTPIVNAENDVILINLNQIPFNAIRVRYISDTAGTGTCDIILLARQLGG